MPWEAAAGPVAALIIAAAALTLTPVWMRPGTYFGVRVAPEYGATAQAQQSRRSFLFAVWAATAFAVALSLGTAAMGKPWLGSFGFLVQLGAATAAFRAGWRKTKPHGLEPPSTRTAHLFTASPSLPGGAAAVAAPFLVLAGVSVYLLTRWDSIPSRFPIHWNLQGHANGWSERSFLGVFGPILIAFAVLVFIVSILAILTSAAPRAPAGGGLDRRNRAALAVPVIVMWIIAIVFSLAALTPLILRNGQFPIPPAVVILIPIAGVIAGIWLLMRAGAAAGETAADNTPNACWKWGQFYYNPDDPSIMIEKRFGIGYTLNFARWPSWLLLGGTLALPIAIVLFARH
jgi:uncharacterized membrane protein